MKKTSKELFSTLLLGLGLWGTPGAHAIPVRSLEVKLPILVAKTGLTLYVFDKDVGGVPSCYDQCASVWPPIVVEAGEDLGSAELSTIARKDGSLQLRHQGKPVYLFHNDKKAGDLLGDGLGGVWHLIRLPLQTPLGRPLRVMKR